MPIYEFSCSRCRLRFEALVSVGAERKVSCPSCGGGEINKLLSTFGIGGGGSRLKESTGACQNCASSSCSTCK